MRYRHDPHGIRLPIKLDTTTHGEFAPVALEPAHHHARAADARTEDAARISELVRLVRPNAATTDD